MNTQDMFTEAHENTKTIQSAYKIVSGEINDGLDEDESSTLLAASGVVESWADSMGDDAPDKEMLNDLSHDLSVLPMLHSDNQPEFSERIEDDMRDVYYAFVVHTTMLYLNAQDQPSESVDSKRMFQ